MELVAPRPAKRSISSCASSNDAPGRNRPSRVPTRKTWVSTGTSGSPYENSSTHAAVLRPTPGSEQRYVAALLDRRGLEPGQVVAVERAQDVLDHLRLRRREAAGADRLLDLVLRGVAHGRPPGKRSRSRP